MVAEAAVEAVNHAQLMPHRQTAQMHRPRTDGARICTMLSECFSFCMRLPPEVFASLRATSRKADTISKTKSIITPISFPIVFVSPFCCFL